MYPSDYDFIYTGDLFDYYVNDRGLTFTEISTIEELLDTFVDSCKGYVVGNWSIATLICTGLG